MIADGKDSWLDLQRKREERMRYELLRLVHRASGGDPTVELRVAPFVHELGTWHAELFRVTEWLERHGLLRYCGAGPVVCITPAGTAFLELHARKRRSVREADLPPPGESAPGSRS